MLPLSERREYTGKRKPRPRKERAERDMPMPKVHPDYATPDAAWDALVRMSQERGA